jgi:hypothetical protein
MPSTSIQCVCTVRIPLAAGEFLGMKPSVHSTHTLSGFGVRLWIMWLRIHLSVVLYGHA